MSLAEWSIQNQGEKDLRKAAGEGRTWGRVGRSLHREETDVESCLKAMHRSWEQLTCCSLNAGVDVLDAVGVFYYSNNPCLLLPLAAGDRAQMMCSMSRRHCFLCCHFVLRVKVKFISLSVYNVGVLWAGVYVPTVDNWGLINIISRI